VKKAGSASDPLWYKDAVIYELHVRAFADSNNDGIGDFAGLIGKLDYLQDLGVTCLWLLPFYPSPLRDDGYDISDYTNVHPNYGSLEDFKQFLDAAHQRGMQVLIELVLNHTSDQHQWFQRARQAAPGSVERDFYVWSDTNDQFPGVRIILVFIDRGPNFAQRALQIALLLLPDLVTGQRHGHGREHQQDGERYDEFYQGHAPLIAPALHKPIENHHLLNGDRS